MKTAIIVATHRRPDAVGRLLRNLGACDLPPDLEVLLVENGPKCGVDQVARAESLEDRVRYAYRPVGNKSVALNHGLGQTQAEFVIFLDDDVEAPPGLVSAYIDAALRHGPGTFFGGGLAPDAEAPCPPHLLPYLPRSVRGWRFSDREVEIPREAFDFFFGANWAAFRADLEGAGLFSVDLGVTQSAHSPVGEETELQHRLLARGGRAVYLPDATIRHPTPREHHTARWLLRRRFRLGVAEWTLRPKPAAERRLGPFPLWVLRTLAARKLVSLLALAGGASIAVRIEHRMEAAHLAGLLWGAWLARRRAAPRPPPDQALAS
jgi:GT2 family glycosyltransferase